MSHVPSERQDGKEDASTSPTWRTFVPVAAPPPAGRLLAAGCAGTIRPAVGGARAERPMLRLRVADTMMARAPESWWPALANFFVWGLGHLLRGRRLGLAWLVVFAFLHLPFLFGGLASLARTEGLLTLGGHLAISAILAYEVLPASAASAGPLSGARAVLTAASRRRG